MPILIEIFSNANNIKVSASVLPAINKLISLTSPSDSSVASFGTGTLGGWFDNYYN